MSCLALRSARRILELAVIAAHGQSTSGSSEYASTLCTFSSNGVGIVRHIRENDYSVLSFYEATQRWLQWQFSVSKNKRHSRCLLSYTVRMHTCCDCVDAFPELSLYSGRACDPAHVTATPLDLR
eukprot:3677263-Amphidinium_carterae.1